MPMQRLTKYPLLIAAISKDTTNATEKQQLDYIVSTAHLVVVYGTRHSQSLSTESVGQKGDSLSIVVLFRSWLTLRYW